MALNSALIFYDASGALELRTPYTHFVHGGDACKTSAPAAAARAAARRAQASPPDARPPFGRQPRPQQISVHRRALGRRLSRDAASIPAALERQAADALGAPGGGVKPDSRAERLRYILHHTLGCPKTFEHRGPSSRCCRAAAISATTPWSPRWSTRWRPARMVRCAHTSRWPSSQQSWATPYSSTAPSIDARCARCRACRACASRCSPTSNSTFTIRSPSGRRRSTPRSAAAWLTTPPGRSGTRRGQRARRGAGRLPEPLRRRRALGRLECLLVGGAWPNAAVQAESNAKAARAEKDPLLWEGVLSDPRDMSVAEWLRAPGYAASASATSRAATRRRCCPPTTRGRSSLPTPRTATRRRGRRPTATRRAARGGVRHPARCVGGGQPRGDFRCAEGRAAP